MEEEPMPHDLDPQQDQESAPQPHRHYCGNLFGCGEEKGTGVFREDIKGAAFTKRAQDRLLHMDEVNQERLDVYLTARGLSRRRLLRASSFMGALAGIGPWFNRLTNTKLAHAADALGGDAATAAASADKDDQGRVHVVALFESDAAGCSRRDPGEAALEQSGTRAALDHRPDLRQQCGTRRCAGGPLQAHSPVRLGSRMQ
jgi:hypothetical protein